MLHRPIIYTLDLCYDTYDNGPALFNHQRSRDMFTTGSILLTGFAHFADLSFNFHTHEIVHTLFSNDATVFPKLTI